MRRVRNRFVAEVLDADVDGPSPYIVTRYVPGRTLEETVRRDGPLRGAGARRPGRGARRGARRHPRGRGGAPRPQAGQRHAGRRPAGDHRLRHRARARLHPADEDRPGHGHSRVPRAGGHRGRRVQRRVGRALLGRHGGLRRHRPPAVRQRHLPDDLLPRARGQAGGRRDAAAPAAVRHRRAVDRPAVPAERAVAGGAARHAQVSGATPHARGGRDPAPTTAVDPHADARRRRWPPAGRAAAAASAPPARVAYRSPAQAARDVADLLPPVAPPVPPRRRRLAPGPAPGRPAAAPRQPDWQPPGLGLLSLAAGVAAVALSVLLPVAGTAISLAVITLLRAADRAQAALAERRSLRGVRPSDIVVVIVDRPVDGRPRGARPRPCSRRWPSSPRCSAAAASVVFTRTRTLPGAGSWAAGAAVAFYCVGPGSGAPRRQLRRMSTSVIRSQGRAGRRLHLLLGARPRGRLLRAVPAAAHLAGDQLNDPAPDARPALPRRVAALRPEVAAGQHRGHAAPALTRARPAAGPGRARSPRWPAGCAGSSPRASGTSRRAAAGAA